MFADKHKASFTEEQIHILSPFSGTFVHKLITEESCLLVHLKPFLLKG